MKKIAWLGLVSSLETSKNRALGKKNKTKTIEKQKENKKKTNKKQIPSISISTSISNSLNVYYENKELNNIFLEYLKLRKKLKAVNSDRAINSLINILKDYDDETKIKLIEQSIVNSWKSIYPKNEIKKGEEPPTWFKKEIKVDTPNSDEISEMEELLSEFRN